MDFGLREGPWKSVFDGIFHGHEAELLRNEEGLLLSIIYEKEGKERVGALVQAFSLFKAEGEVQGFLESLEGEALLLSVHSGEETLHFLAVTSKPSYSKMGEEPMAGATDECIGTARRRAKLLQGIASAYEMNLTPLNECSESEKQAFFSQVLQVQAFHASSSKAMDGEKASLPGGSSAGSVILGVTKGEKQVKEPLHFFSKSLVDGEGRERLHFLHIMAESALLANVPVLIFGIKSDFSGLGQPNSKQGELQRYKVGLEPVGFPLKHFKAGEEIKVNLASVSPEGILESFGCSKALKRLTGKHLEEGKPESLQQVADSLGEGKGKENDFERERAKRALKLFDILYPGLFNSRNSMEEILKGWAGRLGRGSVIDVSGLDARALRLLVNSFLNEMLSFYKEAGKSKQLKAMVLVPAADQLFPRSPTMLSRNSAEALQKLGEYGVGFAAAAKRSMDLDQYIKKAASAKASIVSGNDAAMQVEGRKNYRVLLRPGLSMCSETK